ncbi:MFS transporter [Niastella koreensis]|uniref:Major facilitator superfamily MFS_1 n=2 Tax=Niastella koreensis TaxID=354356 RepID=G8TPZ8_NIAKG|nr:MFS transporter [Niastella koreensis]AEV99992.1 major facilitator superfamily MFS_1 [Niastella koreensis GR20-10]OQP51406.1 MFS transporter [Niastella koreensis]
MDPVKKTFVSKEFIAFTASSMILTALGIDIMLPAFADVRKYFSAGNSSTETAQLVSCFFMGQVTQILFGYLTDRLGRLPILRAGIVLYVITGFLTAFAGSLYWMYVFRFVAGMGAAAVFMTSIASVRDRYAGDAMARVMSLVLFVFLFTPVVAPALGALVLKFYSWRVVFAIPPSFAVIVFIWSFRMQESHSAAARVKNDLKNTLQKLRTIIQNQTFVRYVTIATVLFSVFSSYISSSERIIGTIYQRPKLFPVIFGTIGLFMAIAAISNSYFSKRFGARRTLRILLTGFLGVATVLFALTLLLGDPPPALLFFILMGIICCIFIAADPNSSAIALEPLGDKAGLAASVYGTIFFFVGSGIGTFISNQLIKGVGALTTGFFVAGLIVVMLVNGSPKNA